jgi:7-cyano-7-deazaguanine synthase
MKNKTTFGKKSVVLLSGGLDSSTILYYAISKGYSPYCLIFDYGQRHRRELHSAVLIAKTAKCRYKLVKISLPWKGSSLIDKEMRLPNKEPGNKKIPNTYVPGRNTIFLSFALSAAEALGAKAVFIGANAIDYSGYPDCRPDYFKAFEAVIRRGTKAGAQGGAIKIYTPLIRKTKAQIIRMGISLGVPFELTWSCYQGNKKPCGKCDSCYFRQRGFSQAGINDPV